MDKIKDLKETIAIIKGVLENPVYVIALTAIPVVLRTSASILGLKALPIPEIFIDGIVIVARLTGALFALASALLFASILLIVPCAYVQRKWNRSIRIAGLSINALVGKGTQLLATKTAGLFKIFVISLALWFFMDTESMIAYLASGMIYYPKTSVEIYLLCVSEAMGLIFFYALLTHFICISKDAVKSAECGGIKRTENIDKYLGRINEDKEVLDRLAAMPRRFKKLN